MPQFSGHSDVAQFYGISVSGRKYCRMNSDVTIQMPASKYMQAEIETYSAIKPTIGGPIRKPTKETVVMSDTTPAALSGLRRAATPIRRGRKFALQRPNAPNAITIGINSRL